MLLNIDQSITNNIKRKLQFILLKNPKIKTNLMIKIINNTTIKKRKLRRLKSSKFGYPKTLMMKKINNF